MKDIKVFLKKKNKTSDNTVMNDKKIRSKIHQKMKDRSWFSIGEEI